MHAHAPDLVRWCAWVSCRHMFRHACMHADGRPSHIWQELLSFHRSCRNTPDKPTGVTSQMTTLDVLHGELLASVWLLLTWPATAHGLGLRLPAVMRLRATCVAMRRLSVGNCDVRDARQMLTCALRSLNFVPKIMERFLAGECLGNPFSKAYRRPKMSRFVVVDREGDVVIGRASNCIVAPTLESMAVAMYKLLELAAFLHDMHAIANAERGALCVAGGFPAWLVGCAEKGRWLDTMTCTEDAYTWNVQDIDIFWTGSATLGERLRTRTAAYVSDAFVPPARGGAFLHHSDDPVGLTYQLDESGVPLVDPDEVVWSAPVHHPLQAVILEPDCATDAMDLYTKGRFPGEPAFDMPLSDRVQALLEVEFPHPKAFDLTRTQREMVLLLAHRSAQAHGYPSIATWATQPGVAKRSYKVVHTLHVGAYEHTSLGVLPKRGYRVDHEARHHDGECVPFSLMGARCVNLIEVQPTTPLKEPQTRLRDVVCGGFDLAAVQCALTVPCHPGLGLSFRLHVVGPTRRARALTAACILNRALILPDPNVQSLVKLTMRMTKYANKGFALPETVDRVVPDPASATSSLACLASIDEVLAMDDERTINARMASIGHSCPA